MLTADGVHGAPIAAIRKAVTAEGTVGHFAGSRTGKSVTEDGAGIGQWIYLRNKRRETGTAVIRPQRSSGAHAGSR